MSENREILAWRAETAAELLRNEREPSTVAKALAVAVLTGEINPPETAEVRK